MDIAQLWPSLSAPTRDWLIANNGDAISPEVLDEFVRANGSAIPDDWWGDHGDHGDQSDGADHYLPDDAVDWIEATANQEDTSD
jgi:hypothetical protein